MKPGWRETPAECARALAVPLRRAAEIPRPADSAAGAARHKRGGVCSPETAAESSLNHALTHPFQARASRSAYAGALLASQLGGWSLGVELGLRQQSGSILRSQNAPDGLGILLPGDRRRLIRDRSS